MKCNIAMGKYFGILSHTVQLGLASTGWSSSDLASLELCCWFVFQPESVGGFKIVHEVDGGKEVVFKFHQKSKLQGNASVTVSQRDGVKENSVVKSRCLDSPTVLWE